MTNAWRKLKPSFLHKGMAKSAAPNEQSNATSLPPCFLFFQNKTLKYLKGHSIFFNFFNFFSFFLFSRTILFDSNHFIPKSSSCPAPQQPKIIVILGPTASGKSALGLKLAKKFNGEIVSADSRQVYKELNIGTDKVIGQWSLVNGQKFFMYENVIHHLIDCLPPNQSYSVGQFKKDAEKTTKEILGRRKIPIVVGGTAQYIYALTDNWQIPKIKPNQALRKKLEQELAQKGLNYLWTKLLKLDPAAAQFVQSENPRRVIRALEINLLGQEKFSEIRTKQTPKYDFLLIGIRQPREKLYKKIDQRVDEMIRKGLIKEVKKLMKKYPRRSVLPQTTGYMELIEWLKSGVKDPWEFINKIKYNTHGFVRHQMNWFGKDKRINWVKNFSQAERLTKKFLK